VCCYCGDSRASGIKRGVLGRRVCRRGRRQTLLRRGDRSAQAASVEEDTILRHRSACDCPCRAPSNAP
jgi:hypothetical protein